MTPLILHIEQQREHDDNEGAGDADDHYQASVHHGGQVWCGVSGRLLDTGLPTSHNMGDQNMASNIIEQNLMNN